MHVIIAPLMAYVFLDFQNQAARRMEVASNSISEEHLESNTLILVNPPDSIYTVLSIPMMRANEGKTQPQRLRALAHGGSNITVTRLSDRELRLDLQPGLFPDPFSRYFRSQSSTLRPGDEVLLEDLTVTVEAIVPRTGPSRIRFAFEQPLDQEKMLWKVWNGTEYVSWTPPPVGESLRLESQSGIFG